MFSYIGIKKLIARRSGTASMLLLDLLPMPHVPSKPQLELTFLSMCGRGHLKFLQQSLLSLYMSWSSLPKLQIVSDGNLTLSKLEEALAWWPGVKSFSSWEQSVAYHQQRGRESLVTFAARNWMGRKLAVILEFGEHGATLWCDADILWFKELSSLPTVDKESCLPILKVAEDCQQSYEEDLIKQGLSHLSQPPFLNVGLVFLKGDLIQACNLEHLLHFAANKSREFTEQTILAEAAYQLGQDYWSLEEIACFDHDRLSLATPTYSGKQWVARHYTSPVRYIFWRDALALRLLGLRKES